MAASMSDDPPQVHICFVQIKKPTPDDPGQVAEGRYIIDGATVTLTDAHGVPVRDTLGKTYSRNADHVEPAVMARRLMREFRAAIFNRAGAVSGFGAPIKYKNNGFV